MKVVQTLKPVSISPLGDKFIIDLGQNIAGRLRINLHNVNNGDTVRLRFAETLQKDGSLYVENLRDARCTDTYVCNGREANTSWAPAFVYHGFRYIEVSGYKAASIADFTGEAISDEMDCLGTFTSSNETLNAIYRNAWWGILSNYKGLPVDCPQRNERQPWLGDRTMGCWGESFLFSNDRLYAKWANDICEAQRSDGCIPDVAPAYWNYYSDNVTWPAALPMACDMIYTHFGDKSAIEKHYANIKLWMEHIKDEYMNSEMIVTKDTYGDWCVPPESLELIHSNDPTRNTDGALISTAYYLKMLQTMHRFAEVQGLEEDKEMWKNLEHQVKDAFNKKFLTAKRGTSQVPGHVLYPDSVFYGNNTVTANILPLAFGLVPTEYVDDVVKNVVRTIITGNNGHICCGVIGVQWLMRELSRRGFADVAFLLASNTTYPSYGYMIANGATTIWELWNGNTASPKMNSGNHVMLLGDLLPWFYENIGGIKSDRKRVGFKHIVMRPNFEIQDLSSADVSYVTPYGKVSSKWTKTLQHLDWEVTIPANTTAELHLPNGKVEQIGSGSYKYSVEIPTKDKQIVTDEFLYEKSSFPECHSATIEELKNGDLVAAFFGGTKEANPDCCIWVCRKPKGSSEWTAPVIAADGVFSLDDPETKIAGLSGIDENSTPATAGPARADFEGNMENSRRKACWNPVLFNAPNGELWLFFKIGKKVADWTGWMVRSTDGGKTWSKREALQEGFLGPIKNKPVLLSDGRIICPSSTEGSKGWRVHFEISDDMGKTWKMVGPLDAELDLPTAVRKANVSINADDQEGGEAIKGNDMKPIFAIQPSVLKVGDRLCVLCRTRNAKLATSWSDDNGDTWSKVTLTDVPNNNSGTDAVTLKDGSHALIYNDFETLPGTPKGVRTPLAIAVSKDGVNWSKVVTLEDSPISQYSYPSIIQGKDGSLHAIYTWRRQRIKYAKVSLRDKE
jgi:alpha-L-rhamnosidase